MSIASRTSSIIGHIEDDYNALERLGADLTGVDKNIENIASVVNDIYDKLPKVTGTGSDLSLTPTLKGALDTIPLGNAEQDETPTPDNPIDVKIVTGNNSVVVSNKNLIDYKMINPNASLEDNGYYRVSFPSGTTILSNIFKTNQQYTLSFNGYGVNALNNGRFIINYTDGTSQNVTVAGTTPTDYLFTSTAGKTIDNIKSSWGSAQITYLKDLMLELGTTATSYIAHQEQSYTLHLGSLELCKIGDYQDVITGSKDNWKVVKNIGKVVLNGSENGWGISNTGTPNWYYRLSISLGANNTYNSLFKSNNYSYADIGNNNTNQGFIVLGAYIRFRYRTEDTIENYKTWLSTHNTVIYYILAEPIEETITNTTLIEELNGLQELLSYDGTTNITITSNTNNAQMIISASALKGE